MSKSTCSCVVRGGWLLLAALFGLASASAQTFSSLHVFHGGDGIAPDGSVILASDGVLYGTTRLGGTLNYGNLSAGNIFRVNRDGSGFTVLYQFPDNGTGMRPECGLIEGVDGMLYGTTQTGLPNYGSVFRIAKDGSGYTVLQNFTSLASGGNPYARLVQANDGMLYGTARTGGNFSAGTVFRVNPAGGGFAAVHHFNPSLEGGQVLAGLVQGNDGALYGVAGGGGQYGNGTVFRLNPDGSGFAVLHHFNKAAGEGEIPWGTLIQAADGLLYGTTYHGGTYLRGTVFRLAPDGSGFATIHHFRNGYYDGAEPVMGGLVQGTDGLLYGMTQLGGIRNYGTLFKMATDGSGFAVLVSQMGANGEDGGATLAVDSNGDLYGAAPAGGEVTTGLLNSGLIFCFGAPKVPRITNSGSLGASVSSVGMSYQITATNNPTSFGASGLPPALSVDPATGLITGILTTAGKFTMLLSATNAVGTGYGPIDISVSPAQASVTLGQLSFEYDGTPKPVVVTTSPAGLSVIVRYAGAATAPANAGSYAVVATIDDPNYNGTASGTLVITKAAATVTLGNLAQTYDASAKSATVTTSPAGLGVAFTYDGVATPPVNAGSYAVTATITDPNYTGSGSGTLVVAKASASVTFNPLAQTYDGTPKPVAVTTAPAGLAFALTYNGGTSVPVNAGSYAVATTINDANYSGSGSGTLVVAKAAAGLVLGGLTHTYDGTAKPVTVTTTPAGLTVTVTYAGAATAPIDAANYAVAANVVDANYTGSTNGTLTILPAAQSISFPAVPAHTFGDAAFPLAATASSGLPVVYAVVAGPALLSGNTVTLSGAGNVTLRASQAGSGNFLAAPDVDVSFAVAKAPATVTLGGLAQTFDGAPKPLLAATSPAGLGVVFTYDGSASPPVNAGSYAVTATINDPNYIGSASGTLVVSPAVATITLGNLGQTYDAGPKPVTATTSPAGLAVSLTYNGAASPPVNAGSYAVSAAITNPNYTGSTSGTLVVSPAIAAITLGNLLQTYDGNPKPVTSTTSPAGLAVSYSYDGAASAPVNVGSYAVAATITNPNYSGTSSSTLVVAKAAATVALGNLTQVYDGSAKSVTVTTSPTGLAVSVTYNGSAILPVNAGTYAVAATVNDANYSGSTSGTLLVVQSGTSVILGGLSQTYNGAPRPATVTTTPAGLAVNMTYNGGTSVPVNAGSYAVVANISDANYSGTASGTLVVARAAAGIVLGGLNPAYDGSAKPVTVTTTPAGLAVSVTYNGSATVPTNAGTYSVAAVVTDGNYNGSASATLVIGKATATIALGNLNQTYTGTARAVSAGTVPAGLGVAVTYAGSATAPTNAGTYALAATITDSNYTGSATGTLTVAKAAATVTLTNLAQVYNGTARPVTVTTAPAGLATTVTYNGSTTVPTNAGSYAVVATVNNANYTGTAPGTLKVSQVLQAGSLTRSSSGQATAVTTDAAAPGGNWVKLSSTGTNQWIQFTTTSIPAGTYQLQLVYRSNATRAKHNVKVDSTTFGLTIDQYAATASYQTVTVGSITFATAGTHTIRLTTTAKNAASSGFDLSAVQFILTPP